MQHYIYGRAIDIIGFEGTQLGQGAALDSAASSEFSEMMVEMLDRLKDLKTGKKLLQALDASNHTVTIFKAGVNDRAIQTDPVTMSNPAGIQSEVDCSVKTFAPRHKLLPLGMRGASDPAQSTFDPATGMGIHKMLDDDDREGMSLDYADKLTAIGEHVSRQGTASELTIVLDRAGSSFFGGISRKKVAQKVGISRQQLTEMEAGTRAINQEIYYHMAVLLYQYMTPGNGVNTQVRMEAISEFRRMTDSYTPDVDFRDAPGYIVLGHELIHAWRMMSGRRLVRNGWEEEAMTTGLFKFSDLEFTENKLRNDAHLPSRPRYQRGQCSSMWMSQVMGDLA